MTNPVVHFAAPEAKVQHYRRTDLKPFEKNARLHTEPQIAKLVESMQTFGWTIPILIDEVGMVLAGHGRLLAAAKLDMDTVPCLVARGWTDAQKRAYVIADNQLTIAGGWDKTLLREELQGLAELDVNVDMLGFPSLELDKLLGTKEVEREAAERANSIEGEVEKRAELGDVWKLGAHTVVCGDCTDQRLVASAVMGEGLGPEVQGVIPGALVDLVHADPPYGMGKEADGVANDNLYGVKLDEFQNKWFAACAPYLRDNASAYVWGNAEDLWRWWFEENGPGNDWSVRNEIVWDKQNVPGMGNGTNQSYAPATERCLFLMRGDQHLGKENFDAYWEGYEPIRQWMLRECAKLSWARRDVDRITGTQMGVRWLTKSQFLVIKREHYETLRAASYGVAFDIDYPEFCRQFADVIDAGKAHRVERQRQLEERRSFFDNTHDAMTDVWQFPRVTGANRFGHATPKPVEMIARAVRSSCPDGGLVYEPFLGTGSTLIACEITSRRCVGMEIEPAYVDIVLHRWEQQTGQKAEKIA